MKKIALLLIMVMIIGIGCAGTLEKECKKLTKISEDINAYAPDIIQMVAEGKLSKENLDILLECMDYIEKAKTSACILQEVWKD